MKKTTKKIGIVLIIFGILFLLDQNNIFGYWGIGDFIKNFWPLVLIGLGIYHFDKGKINMPITLIGLGIIFQISILTDWKVWPLILVLVGVLVLSKEDNLCFLKRKKEIKIKKEGKQEKEEEQKTKKA